VTPVNVSAGKNVIQLPVTFGPREALIFVVSNVPAARVVHASAPQTITISDLKGSLTFQPSYAENLPKQQISTLKSYTDFADSSIQYFSGIAQYTIKFDKPSAVGKTDSILLSLGDIEATAEVRLNGKPLGTIWMPDYRLDVTGLLQAKNVLEITVANAYRNRIVGDFRQHGLLKNVWTSANVADVLNKEKILKPSGVMGPLQLIVHKRKAR
jgi:hypothetical protein